MAIKKRYSKAQKVPKKDKKDKGKVARVYKRRNSRVRDELNFRIPGKKRSRLV